MKTILIAILAGLSVALVGVLGYQKLTQPELALVAISRLQVNQNQDNCVKEGGNGYKWYGPEENKKDDICCDNLVEIDDRKDDFPQIPGGLGSGFICAYCGNGVCGTGENKYNCPEDCK